MDFDFTLVKKKVSPFKQFGIAVAAAWIGMLICRAPGIEPGSEYFAAMIGIIFFTLINTVVSISYSSFLRYTVPSWYIYILLVVVLFLSAKLFSGISIWHLEEYRMMLV